MIKNKTFLFFMLLVGIILFITIFSLVVFIPFNIDSSNNSLTFGARIATIVVAFATFVAQSMFSFLIYLNNRAISKSNVDANLRAQAFQELQFISSNYSIIEFNDRMLLSIENDRYVNKLIKEENDEFHMLQDHINILDVYENPANYRYITVRIPFALLEGKLTSSIRLERITFERDLQKYRFVFSNRKEEEAFLLFNEYTRRRNMIINLIFNRETDFFNLNEISNFSKIKIRLSVISVLGVKIKGISELYFTNPVQIEGDLSNTYKITSSIFTMTESPKLLDSTNLD
ncbi:MAG: hypothetical protein LBV55_00045 [Acholeplasmatales bacterium]|jgi:hypothetical protein|nr:hypothetical protein [Acholeplasmatales bacterium]